MTRTFTLSKKPLGVVLDSVTLSADSPVTLGRLARSHFAERWALDGRLQILPTA